MKREGQPMQQQHRLKNLRSSLPRRRRSHISPIRLATSPAPSIASSHLTREVSCESSRISVNNKPRAASPKKRRFEDITGLGQSKQLQKAPKREKEENAEEERDFSCVQSCSGLDVREINSKEFGVIEEHSVTTAKSELSCEFPRGIPTAGDENSVKNDVQLSEASRNVTASKSDSVKNDLACSESELVCYDDNDVSDYTSSFTDLQSSEVFLDSWEVDFSDEYTPSILFESGSEFSEKSITDDVNPSPLFSLLLQYGQQFSRSTSGSLCSRSVGENSKEFTCLRLENEEDEESYRMLRNRERRQVYVHDYAEEYCSATEYGELVIQQRLRMVHWIVEQCTKKEFQKETMFLGVSLLDRLLSKGYFITERNLQIVGIACLALATRIEENQPFNSVRKKILRVDSNTYSRCEVVAMEWLVQRVLNFQCFLPTIYNFLWFYLKAAKANEEVEKTAKYLAMVALLGHEQLRYWPSTVAAGLVVLASLAANQDASCDLVMETHLRTKEDDLPGCMKSLEWLIKYAC